MKTVILAGGSGTRLWPLSRKNKPKQLHKLVSSKTLLQESIDRLDFLKPEDIYIATNENYVEEVMAQAKGIPKENIIIEPAMRDTATCIGYAAAYIGRKHPDEVLAVIYSDQLIQEKEIFQEKLQVAAKIAKKEKTINIIEVKARYPSTAYGYVMIGDPLPPVNGHEVYEFEKFTEKPDLKTAKKFVDSFKYLWNTGLYVFRIDTMLEAYKNFLPDTHERLKRMVKHMDDSWANEHIKSEYKQCEKISIDYGIMEKVDKKKVRIIPAYLGWSDIGTWHTLHEELANKPESNVLKGKTALVESEGSLVYNYTDKLVAGFGLKDMVIIETDEVLLVCPREKSTDLKKIIGEIKDSHKELL